MIIGVGHCMAKNNPRVAAERWKFLKSAIVKSSKESNCEAEDSQLWHRTSVRRFGSFKLFFLEELPSPEAKLLCGAHLSCCTEPGADTWIRYSYKDASLAVSAKVKFLTSSASLSTIAGFNNTGNICLWPSEEVMAWYCLRNAHRLFSGRRVCELGCGMTALAGVLLARTGLPAEVLLTDGNDVSIRNVDTILSANFPSPLTTTVRTCVLRWDEPFLSQPTPYDEAFDVIICADCVFFKELHTYLNRVLLKLLKPHGTVIIFAPERGSTLRQFCELTQKDFAIQRLDTYDDVVDQRHHEALAQAERDYDPDIHYPVLVELRPIGGHAVKSGSEPKLEEHRAQVL